MDIQSILDSTSASLNHPDDDDDDDDDEEESSGYYPQPTTHHSYLSPDNAGASASTSNRQWDPNNNNATHLLSDSLTEEEDEGEDYYYPPTSSSSLLNANKTTSMAFNGEHPVGNLNNIGKGMTGTTTRSNARTNSSVATASGDVMDVDLERILREDDDDDSASTGSNHVRHHDHSRSRNNTLRPRLSRHDHDPISDYLDDDDDDDDIVDKGELYSYAPIVAAGTVASAGATASQAATAATGEDWHILQAILGEDEDDVDVFVSAAAAATRTTSASGNVNQHYHGSLRSAHATGNTPSHPPVDAILQQSDDDDDDDDNRIHGRDLDLDLLNDQISFFNDEELMYIPQLQQQQKFALKNYNHDAQDNEGLQVAYSSESFQTAHQSVTATPSDDDELATTTASAAAHTQQQHQLSDAQLDKASERAMQHAQTYETRLLKASNTAHGATNSNKDIVSPLMVKRRLKPKIYVQSKACQAKGAVTASPLSSKVGITAMAKPALAVATPRATYSTGTVELRHMHGVSATLLKQQQQQQLQQQMQSSKKKHLPPRQPPQPPPQKDLPTALGMNDRFLAVGMQSGACLIFDLFETFRRKLDKGGDTPFDSLTAGAVTTLDLSFEQGEILVAGYTSGYIVLWDVLKGVALRTVIESITNNPSPSPSTSTTSPNRIYPSCMTHVRFLKGLEVVTVDAGGLVNKLAFSKNLLWSSYSVESECLLDGTAGQILAMNVLDPTVVPSPNSSSSSDNNSGGAYINPKGLVLIALSSERSSFAVAVAPSVHVLYRWARPPPEQVSPPNTAISSKDSQVYLPCLSWGWAIVAGGDNIKTPILARAWGFSIQLLRASFQDPLPQTSSKHDDHSHPAGGSGSNNNINNTVAWPAFGVHDEFSSFAPVVALEWLNDRSLVYLTVQNEFTVIDTVMMTLVEKIDFSGLSLVYAEFSLSRSNNDKDASPDEQVSPTQSPSFCTTFQNSIRSRDNRLLLLCQDELQSVSIVGAKRRISQLEQDGEWLEALASALDHYESTIASQQDRRRDLKKDMTKHPEYAAAQNQLLTPDEEWIAKLLIRYIHIAIENAPELSDYELAQSHFQMLAGVCIEFCVVTKRLDLLYGPIFRRFHAVGCLSVFLDVLEPYILNDKLDYIAPEAMAHFVEHCRIHNGMSTVERCLLHMDVTIMDFDSILTLLKANEMYSALFYVYNQGLKDYVSPLEILLEKIFDGADTTLKQQQQQQPAKKSMRIDGAPRNDLEKYGYKAILYLQYCFQGRTFPQNVLIENDQQRYQIRSQLLSFLVQKRFSPTAIRKTAKVVGQRTQDYPYATILLMVDSKAMLNTFSLAMDALDHGSSGGESSSLESIGGWDVEVNHDRNSNHGRSSNNDARILAPNRQEIIRVLLSIILPDKSLGGDPSTKQFSAFGTLCTSQYAIDSLLDFLAEYLMKGVVRTNKHVTLLILNRMATRFESAMDARDRLDSQQRILELLTALPHNSYEPEEVLVLVQKSGIHRAALLLHQEGASSWREYSGSLQQMEQRAYHFKAAIDCYLDDDDSEFCKEVFLYVKKECSSLTSDYQQTQQNELTGEEGQASNQLRAALASKLADLVQLDSLLTAELVAELFVDDLDSVVNQLHDEHAQFLFFQAIISGDLDRKDQVAGALLNANLTVDHHHRYLELMAKLHPAEVYEYLQTHDSYRPEACLPLCQKYDIADASCYLLERMGNVSSGLQLILQTLESRMMGLKRIIRGMGTTSSYNKYSTGLRHKNLAPPSNGAAASALDATESEIQAVKRILIVALDLCERNSGTFSSRTEHGSQLWFNVLDRLINAKGFLRLSKEQPGHARIMAGVLSDLLRLVMQRMVSSVPLPDLVRKVTSDHSGSRLGELREMVESLLSTYGFELTLFDGAVRVFHHDLKEMQRRHRFLRIQGDRVKNIINVSTSDPTNARLQNGMLGGPNPNSTTPITITNIAAQTAESHGLGTALLKLQRRRQQQQENSPNPIRHGHHHRTRINLMPESERQIFVGGQDDPDATYWEDRVAGLLGVAEHSGRFRSFLH
jgi:vacuolar protein sorting-associated protein 8